MHVHTVPLCWGREYGLCAYVGCLPRVAMAGSVGCNAMTPLEWRRSCILFINLEKSRLH
jgi:hypothetical protein